MGLDKNISGQAIDISLLRRELNDAQAELVDLLKTKKDLAEKNRLNEIILDSFPCVALILKTGTWEIVQANKRAREEGVVPGAVCYKTWGDLKGPCSVCHAPKLWATGKTQHAESKEHGSIWDKYWVPVNENIYLHYAFNITEQRNKDQELARTLSELKETSLELSALLKASRVLIESHSIENTIETIYRSSKALIGSKSGYLAVTNEDGSDTDILFIDTGEEICSTDTNLPMPLKRLRLEAAKTKKTVICNDFSESKWASGMPANHPEMKNFMLTPLIVDDRVSGFIGLSDKPGGFTQADAGRAEAFGEFASLALIKSKSHNDLLKSENKYRQLFNKLTDMVFIIQFDGGELPGRFLEVNDIACRKLGYSRKELLGLGPMDIERPEKRKDSIKTAELIAANKHALFSRRLVAKDGTEIPSEIDAHIVDFQSKPAMLAIARDVSERNALEDRLRQSQKMEAVGILAGGIAHDFNNLLTIISGYSDLLLTKISEDSSMRKELSEIGRAADRASSITQQLLTFSRKQATQPEILNLNQSIEQIEPMLLSAISENIELEKTLGNNINKIKVDPLHIEQILINLTTNARDAMPNGGRILIATSNIDLKEDSSMLLKVSPGPYVLLSVRDCGGGISTSIAQKIFDPFFTTKEVGRGTGLGLFTVYSIMKACGGTISFESSGAGGTVFNLYFPRAAGSVKNEAKSDLSPEITRGSETVLVVEDEPIVLEFVGDALSSFGYTILKAGGGKEALRVLHEYAGRIDLVITDVIMPQMNGSELAKKILSIYPDIKILFISGHTKNALPARSIIEKEILFLKKPFKVNKLVEKIHEILD